jgi:hypothetical protein
MDTNDDRCPWCGSELRAVLDSAPLRECVSLECCYAEHDFVGGDDR